ncbi:hypothetical protein CARUB_v10010669mg [Capsella rubella]|uniref:Uncharacterized protein n=1 Tax=Capsella rubella TaxID=81985 RepID=R0GSC3_9BRAS|nr:hypothetical protein CARUB_v10010669mg [Capsella rubella]
MVPEKKLSHASSLSQVTLESTNQVCAPAPRIVDHGVRSLHPNPPSRTQALNPFDFPMCVSDSSSPLTGCRTLSLKLRLAPPPSTLESATTPAPVLSPSSFLFFQLRKILPNLETQTRRLR